MQMLIQLLLLSLRNLINNQKKIKMKNLFMLFALIALFSCSKSDESIYCYPNPTTGKVQISEICSGECYNYSGSLQFSWDNESEIDLSMLPSSSYVLKIGSEKIRVVKID